MKLSIETFQHHNLAPLYQAGLMLIVILILNTLALLSVQIGITDESDLTPWVISGMMLLAFTFMNTLIGLSSELKMAHYYGKSILGFLALAMSGAFLAKTFSGLSLGEAGTMWWIYLVIAIGYLIFMGIMVLMKTIVAFAQQEDENLRQNK